MSPATNVSVIDLTWNEEEARSVKRRRTETELEENIVSGQIRKIAKKARELGMLEKRLKRGW